MTHLIVERQSRSDDAGGNRDVESDMEKTHEPGKLFDGLEIRPYAYLSKTNFAFLDLNSLRVSPELFERIKNCKDGEVEAQFKGIKILDLRKYIICRN
jgi:hypothetical protein